MTNAEFLKYEGIIYGVLKKYRNCKIEFDDLYQIASIAILKGYERYDAERGTKLETYLFQCCIWAINNELCKKSSSVEAFLTLDAPITEDMETTHKEQIQDDIDIQEDIQSKLMLEFYYNEISAVLPNSKRDALVLAAFHGCTERQVAEILGIKETTAVGRLRDAKNKLITRSEVFKEEYKKLKRKTEFRNPSTQLLL